MLIGKKWKISKNADDLWWHDENASESIWGVGVFKTVEEFYKFNVPLTELGRSGRELSHSHENNVCYN